MLLMSLQVSSSKSHRASKVLYIEGLKMLLSTGSSPWNHRQIVLWDPVRPPAVHLIQRLMKDPSSPAVHYSGNLVSWVFVCRKTYLNLCMKKIWTGQQESSSHSTTRTQTCSTWLERSRRAHIPRILCTLDPLRHAMCSDVFHLVSMSSGRREHPVLRAER